VIYSFIQAPQDLISNLPVIHKKRLQFSCYHKSIAK